MRKTKEKKKKKNDALFKTQMYLISLWLLFILIFIITIGELPDRQPGIGWQTILLIWCKENWLAIICVFMVIVGFVLYKLLEHRWNGTRDLPVKVVAVENENYEYLTFLTTYIIPLVCINMEELRYLLVLFLLLVVIGVIFVKSDFYLGNPMLALMNYRLYKIQYQEGAELVERKIITKDTIQVGDYIEAVPFDEKTWYARRSRK